MMQKTRSSISYILQICSLCRITVILREHDCWHPMPGRPTFKGTILLAEEGINAMIAGEAAVL